jgi:hypothetical protein
MDDSNRDLTFLYDLRDELDMIDDVTEVVLRADGEGFVMFQVYLEQWIPWTDDPVFEPLELQLDYDTLAPGVGTRVAVEASVINNQESPIKMALVELVAPVGMAFDPDDFDFLLEAGYVDNVEYEDDVVRLYINDLEQNHPVVFHYNLDAELEAEVTLAGVRVFDMYNNLIEMELEPITITIGSS